MKNKELINEIKEVAKVLHHLDASKYPSGGISSNELFSNRLENREKIQKWATDAGIKIKKRIVFDFTDINNITSYTTNDNPTNEEILKIIFELLTFNSK